MEQKSLSGIVDSELDDECFDNEVEEQWEQNLEGSRFWALLWVALRDEQT